MSAPFTDWESYFSNPLSQQSGPISAPFTDWDAYFRRPQLPSPAVQTAAVQAAAEQQAQQPGPVTPEWHDDDLVGAAAYWRIPEEVARQMPREALIQLLNEKRKARPEHGYVNLLSMAGIGAAQGAVHGLFNLPLRVGEAMRRVSLLQRADFQLHKMEEGVRAIAPEDKQWQLTGANVAGDVAALFVPAEAAWAVGTRFGRALPFIKTAKNAEGIYEGVGLPSRMALGAVQGGLSSFLLAGGSDSFKEHPVLFTSFGAGLGIAGAEVANWLTRRAAKNFVPVMGPALPEGGLIRPSQPGGPIVTGPNQFREAFQPAMGPEIPGNMRPSQLGHGAADEGQVLTGSDAFFGFKGPQQQGITSEESTALASQLNKAATITQSPAFPSIAGQTQIDDLSVLAAAEATNPGGAQIIQGISNPAQFMEGLPANTHFVSIGNRLDALVLPPEIDANRAIQQYKKFGFFEGQSVLTQEGIQGTLSAIGKDGALFTPTFSGPAREIGIKELQGWLTTGITQDVPQLWDGFVQYAAQRARATAQSMQAGEAAISSITKQNLPFYAEDFLTELGISDPAARARLMNYFNKMYVKAIKDLAPVESALQDAAIQNYNNTALTHPQTPLQALDEIAASKGFIAIPDGTAVIVKDLSASAGADTPQFRFDSIDSAHDFLRNLNRELPDITPPSDVPLEVMGMVQREATQGSNLNHGAAEKIAESASGLSAADGGAGFVPPEQVIAESGGPNNIGRAKNWWARAFSYWAPARRLFSKLDQAMFEHGFPTSFAADTERMSQRVVQHHNDMNPWMDELAVVTGKIDTDKLVSGAWARLLTLHPEERAAQAARLGFEPREIAAFEEMDELMKRVLQHVNGAEAPVDTREIWDYFAHIARRQSDPATVASAFDYYPLSASTQAFYDFARTGNLNFRELDPRHVGESFIRSLFWQKNMQGLWTELAEKWRGLAQTPELAPAGELMKNWLNIVRYGYAVEDDTALLALHGTMRRLLGEEVTLQQAREVFNFGLNATHSGMLGFRPHVMARDALQLFLAVPRAGTDLLNVIRRFGTSEEARTAILREAIDEGAVSLQSPRRASPGAFGGELEALGANAEDVMAMGGSVPVNPSEYGRRMRTVAKVQSAVRDMMPTWLRDVHNTVLHPMYFYGKQSEVMRAITYTAGKEKAARALAVFREGGSMDLDGLMGASGARTYDPSWQREFQKLVASGDDQAAARFLGRQLADATQFKYGLIESPWAAKSLTGKMAMQLGNYQLQYLQYLRESLVNGTWTDKAKLAMTFAAVTGGLEAATRETGWNFRWMNPFFGLGFMGGPWITILPEIARAGADVMREMQGGNPNEAVRAAGAAALQQGLENLNPTGGLIRTGQGIGEALSTSPYPGRAIGRLFITGERGNQPDVNQYFLPQAQQMFQQSLQQHPSPVNATQVGLPPGVIPQQPASYDPTIASPFQTLYQSNQSPASPVPGGAGYGLRAAPGVSATYDDINRAAAGDPNALNQFSPEDQHFLLGIAQMSPDARMAAWAQYQAVKINSLVEDPSRLSGRNGSLVYGVPEPFDSTQQSVHNVGQMMGLLQPGQTIDQYVRGVLQNPQGPAGRATVDVNMLDPDTRGRLSALQSAAAGMGIQVDVGETAREQARQNALFRQGRGAPGPVVTWTLTSSHTGGHAVDVIVNGDSTGRDPGYAKLHALAKTFGFVTLNPATDPGHLAVTDSSRKAVPFTGAQF